MSMLQRVVQLVSSFQPGAVHWARGVEFLIRCIVPIASIVIAFYAYKIQMNLISQEKERAAIARSIVLYDQFTESDSARYLLEVANDIQTHLWRPGESGYTHKDLVKAFGENDFYENREKIRAALADLLHDVNSIFKCGVYEEEGKDNNGQEDTYSEGTKEPLCDRHTISVLFGEKLSEIFYLLRPVLYCDDFMRSNYFYGSPRSAIGKFESLIMDHLTRDVRSTGNTVFRTEVHWRDAEHEVSGSYRIVRLPEALERCGSYRQKPKLQKDSGTQQNTEAGTD